MRHPLLTPYQLGPLELANRIVMAPMTRNRAGAGNVPTDLVARYYRQRASAGLIVTEGSQISPEGVGYPSTPGIHTDEQVAAWRRVTDAVHEEGGHIFLQLWHVGRISHPVMQPDGQRPVAPSAIAAPGQLYTSEGMKPFVAPRALETEEIPRLVADFAAAARRAIEAGFDGVEIHGANGYLIDQFLHDGTNRRTDRYGGTVENRARFLLEVTDAVTAAVGAERVGVRVSPRNPFNGMHDSDPVRTFGHVASALSPFGLAYLHVVEPVGTGEDDPAVQPIVPLARALFRGTLIVNGGYGLETGDEAIRAGAADLVSFGAPFISNPDLPARFAVGAELAAADRSTFYGGGAAGYVDYPAMEEVGR